MNIGWQVCKKNFKKILKIFPFFVIIRFLFSEHLRKSAEFVLKDLVQHLFVRLPEFAEDSRTSNHVKKFKMNKGSVDPTSSKQRRKTKSNQPKKPVKQNPEVIKAEEVEKSKTPETIPEGKNILDMQGDLHQERNQEPSEVSSESVTNTEEQPEPTIKLETKEEIPSPEEPFEPSCVINVESSQSGQESLESSVHNEEQEKSEMENQNQDYVNQQGVRFTSDMSETEMENQIRLQPYGLGCIRELFRFLISLINPMDKQNTEMMIHVGLTLLGVAFEVGADAIGKHASLLAMVKDELCRNLFSVSIDLVFSVF